MMSEDKKNEEKTTKVNVIRRAAPQHKAEEPVQHQAEAEKKVIVLKKKPVVVKVCSQEEACSGQGQGEGGGEEACSA